MEVEEKCTREIWKGRKEEEVTHSFKTYLVTYLLT